MFLFLFSLQMQSLQGGTEAIARLDQLEADYYDRSASNSSSWPSGGRVFVAIIGQFALALL